MTNQQGSRAGSQFLAMARPATSSERWLDSLARRIVHRSLARITRGRVTVIESGDRFDFGDEQAGGLAATVYVHRAECYRAVAFGGSIGAGSAYVDGLWSSSDLPALIRIFAVNRDSLFALEGGWARIARPAHRLYHFLRRNTRRGSRRNVADHYDLGNDFYELFLDDTMAYSCGIFTASTATMREASTAKFDLVCEKLRLSSADHLLEIGTGWGGFAIHAAKNYGCRVTSTTISHQQYELARRRVAEAGLSHRIEILESDYRDLEGRYDKIVSIEMIEAVGHRYFDTFFAACSRLLRPDGVMLLQAITIADQEFDRHQREVDFIKRYVFPGSCIPSVTALVHSMTRMSDLRLFGLEDITRHYVTTLQKWREAFWKRADKVRTQEFSEPFIRMWDFYLAYCEGGFAERYLGNVQMVLVKSDFRPRLQDGDVDGCVPSAT